MRVATLQSEVGRFPGLVLGEPENAIIHLGLASTLIVSGGSDALVAPSSLMALIQSPGDVLNRLRDLGTRVVADASLRAALLDRDRVKFCAPLDHPGKIICLAGNYREHITESGFQAPQ